MILPLDPVQTKGGDFLSSSFFLGWVYPKMARLFPSTLLDLKRVNLFISLPSELMILRVLQWVEGCGGRVGACRLSSHR